MSPKEKLTAAFKSLRKIGLIARQNYSCCQGCAGYAIAEMVEAMPADKRRNVLGCVFYHRQDAQALEKTGEVYLSFGQIDTAKCGAVGFPTTEVGDIIACHLMKQGLAFEWDGSEHTRILVKLGE